MACVNYCRSSPGWWCWNIWRTWQNTSSLGTVDVILKRMQESPTSIRSSSNQSRPSVSRDPLLSSSWWCPLTATRHKTCWMGDGWHLECGNQTISINSVEWVNAINEFVYTIPPKKEQTMTKHLPQRHQHRSVRPRPLRHTHFSPLSLSVPPKSGG